MSITDFVQARATNRDLPLVLEKIKGNYTDAKMYMLLHQENAQLVRVLLGGANEEVTRTLGGVFSAAERQGEFLSFTLEKDSLDAAEETLLALLDPSTKK